MSGASSFTPIPELQGENSRITLFFMTSGRVLFTRPTKDSWYGPTTNTIQVHRTKLSSNEINATAYRQNQPGSPLACKFLEQLCWVGKKGIHQCTSLSSNAFAENLDMLDPEDSGWIRWLRWSALNRVMELEATVVHLGSHALRARDRLNGPLVTLPDNQWQTEILHWHATNMAHLQGLFIEGIIGYKKFNISTRPPNNTDERTMCENQVSPPASFVYSLTPFPPNTTCFVIERNESLPDSGG